MADVAEPLSPSAAPAEAKRGRYRALLADDSESIRVLVRALLSLEDELEIVGEAADGRQAVEIAESVEADVLVLDIAMPLLDGLEVIERLRLSRPRLRIVVYSGFADDALGRRALELGAADFVVKGVPPDQLIARVLSACRNGRSR